MEMKSVAASVILAVGIAGGAALLGSQLSDGIESFVNRDRIVTVKGLAEREVKADRVIWPVGYRELGNDLQDVYKQIEVRQNQVLAFLRNAGLTDAEISVTAPKVDLVLDLMKRQSELLKEGVALANDYSWQTSYQFTGLNTIKPAMIEEATKNARTAAEKFAGDSGSTAGVKLSGVSRLL